MTRVCGPAILRMAAVVPTAAKVFPRIATASACVFVASTVSTFALTTTMSTGAC